jgi:hypothetical protein
MTVAGSEDVRVGEVSTTVAAITTAITATQAPITATMIGHDRRDGVVVLRRRVVVNVVGVHHGRRPCSERGIVLRILSHSVSLGFSFIISAPA